LLGGFGSPGEVRFVFLHPDGTLKGSSVMPFPPVPDQDGFGGAVTNIGDVDGNGMADLAIGAPTEGPTSPPPFPSSLGHGGLYIALLNPGGTLQQIHHIGQIELGGVLALRSEFGASHACGDFDGDGALELAVGAPGAGHVYVLELTPSGALASWQRIDRDEPLGLAGADGFGNALANLGDRDGNGTEDLAVGAPDDAEGMVLSHSGFFPPATGALHVLHTADPR
jgi:hypothetical protein